MTPPSPVAITNAPGQIASVLVRDFEIFTPGPVPESTYDRSIASTIPPEEAAVSIDVVIALRDSFAKESPAVRALFDALVDLLTGSGQMH